MDTLTIVLTMVAMMVVLLAAAIVVDRVLQRRMTQRRALEESPEGSARRHDAADAIIDVLNRSGDLLRRAMQGGQDERK